MATTPANPANRQFIASVCAAAASGRAAISASLSNANQYQAYFAGVLAPADFNPPEAASGNTPAKPGGTYGDLVPADIAAAMQAVAAIGAAVSANNTANPGITNAQALAKVAIGSNAQNIPNRGQGAGQNPKAAFIAAACSVAKAGVNAIEAAAVLAADYAASFGAWIAANNTGTTTPPYHDFTGAYQTLRTADIAAAIAAIAAIQAALTANNNALLAALLKIAR